MHTAGGSRGGPSAQVDAITPSTFNRDWVIALRWGVRGGGMAPGVCKIWLSGLGGAPQISWKSGR